MERDRGEAGRERQGQREAGTDRGGGIEGEG